MLLVFTPEGALIDSVPLNAVHKRLGEIGGITVIDRDTIMLTGKYSSNLAEINHQGTIIRTLDLGKTLQANDGTQFELWPAKYSSFMIDGSAFFHISLVANSIVQTNMPTDDPFKAVYAYYHRAARAPFLVKVDLGQGNVAVSFGIDSLYFKIDSLNPLMPEVGNYECLNNLIFVHSTYSPWVMVVEPKAMKQIARFEIETRQKQTHLKPIAMAHGQVPNLQDSVTTREGTRGYVKSIHYDQPTGHYLISLVHALKDNERDPEQVEVRSYSLLEYDGRFQFIRELELEEGEYAPTFMLSLKRGTYIRRSLGQRSDMRGIHSYVRLNLNETY